MEMENENGEFIGCKVIIIEQGEYNNLFGIINRYTMSGTKEGVISMLVGESVGGGTPLIEIDNNKEIRGDEYHWVDIKEAIAILSGKCKLNNNECMYRCNEKGCEGRTKAIKIIKEAIQKSSNFIKEKLKEEIETLTKYIN